MGSVFKTQTSRIDGVLMINDEGVTIYVDYRHYQCGTVKLSCCKELFTIYKDVFRHLFGESCKFQFSVNLKF